MGGGLTTCSPSGSVVWRAMLARLWQLAVRGGAEDRQTPERLCRHITRQELVNKRVRTIDCAQVVLTQKTHGAVVPRNR